MEKEKSPTFLGSGVTLLSLIAGVEFGYYHARVFVPQKLDGKEWILLGAPAVAAFCFFMDYLGEDVQSRSNQMGKAFAKTLGCYALVQLGTGVAYNVGSAVGTLVDKLGGIEEKWYYVHCGK